MIKQRDEFEAYNPHLGGHAQQPPPQQQGINMGGNVMGGEGNPFRVFNDMQSKFFNPKQK